jgi:hypothetical protein
VNQAGVRSQMIDIQNHLDPLQRPSQCSWTAIHYVIVSLAEPGDQHRHAVTLPAAR